MVTKLIISIEKIKKRLAIIFNENKNFAGSYNVLERMKTPRECTTKYRLRFLC